MRTKQIVRGLANSQKFRFILTSKDGAKIGMVITVQQMSDCFATSDAQLSVWRALDQLVGLRTVDANMGRTLTTGLVTDAFGFRQVQVDLH
jgi:hypothetical protein